MEEQTVWEGTPSQIVNLKVFILCGLTFWLVFPLFIGFWYWLKVNSCRYCVTTERIIIREGVFSRHTDELELYRVRDICFEEPFFLRLFSLSNLVLSTTDPSNPTLTLKAIHQGQSLWNQIRKYAEICRRNKGIQEFDVT